MPTQRLQERPTRGMSMHEALEHYSDPAAYAAMEEARNRESDGWEQQLRRLSSPFAGKLRSGDVVASAIPDGGDRREVIHKIEWEFLVIDYDYERIVGAHRYVEAEFFEPSAIPENIPVIPHWLRIAARISGTDFTHDESYENVRLGEENYRLGPKQAHIVKALHQASTESDGWLKGRRLLDDAGSESAHISDLFKHHKGLIESDRRGKYRLNLPKR